MHARESRPPGGGRFDEAGDATRRTRLANERTYLAWWRTALTAFAVSIGSGKLVPELASGGTWAYTAIGIGFAVVGVFCSVYAFWRYREVEDAISRGGSRTGSRLASRISGFRPSIPACRRLRPNPGRSHTSRKRALGPFHRCSCDSCCDSDSYVKLGSSAAGILART